MAQMVKDMLGKMGIKKEVKFDQSKLSQCIVAATADFQQIAPNPVAFEVVKKHYTNIVAMIGMPGSGKSTFASTIYNVMRGDKLDYFAQSKSLEGFTKGVWTLKDSIKAMYSECDTMDVLDLEGLEDEDVIHWFVVASMSMAKAVVLCTLYGGSPRINYSMFTTLRNGLRVYKANNIKVPSPIIYVQVPYGQTEFQLNKGMVDGNGLIDYIKQRYKELKTFEIRLFSLPTFKKNRFEKEYQIAVKKMVKEFTVIPSKVTVEERIDYTYTVINALNDNSPELVADSNLKFFKNRVDKIKAEAQEDATKQMLNKAVLPALKKSVSFGEFIHMIFPDGRFAYGAKVCKEAKELSYYQKGSPQYEKVIRGLTDKELYVEAATVAGMQTMYDNAIFNLKKDLKNKSNKLKEIQEDLFVAFINKQVSEYRPKFQGSTALPNDLRSLVKEFRGDLIVEFKKRTQNLEEVDDDYLDMNNLTIIWNQQ